MTTLSDEARARLERALDDYAVEEGDAHEAGENTAAWEPLVEVHIGDLCSALAEIDALREAAAPLAALALPEDNDGTPDARIAGRELTYPVAQSAIRRARFALSGT